MRTWPAHAACSGDVRCHRHVQTLVAIRLQRLDQHIDVGAVFEIGPAALGGADHARLDLLGLTGGGRVGEQVQAGAVRRRRVGAPVARAAPSRSPPAHAGVASTRTRASSLSGNGSSSPRPSFGVGRPAARCARRYRSATASQDSASAAARAARPRSRRRSRSRSASAAARPGARARARAPTGPRPVNGSSVSRSIGRAAERMRQPACGGQNSSVGPPAVVITGNPQAIASSTGIAKPSPRYGCTSTSQER